MALDENIALHLYDRMFEIITGSDPSTGLPSAFDTATTKFLMAPKGLVINGADYRNPWTPGNPTGSTQAAENVASLADPIPASTTMYLPGTERVSDVYSSIANMADVTEEPISEEDLARRDQLNQILYEVSKDEEGRTVQKPSALADKERLASEAYNDAYNAYIAQFLAAQRDPALAGIWPIVGAQAVQRPKRAFQDWASAGRNEIQAAKAALATMNKGQVARTFLEAQWKLLAFQMLNSGETVTFPRTSVSPSDWASGDASTWPSYEMSDSTVSTSHTSEATSWGAAANVNVGLWSFGGGVESSDSRQAMSSDTTDIGVKFRWRVCPINRKWMDGTLFGLPNWSLNDLGAPGSISDGAGGGRMPLIPIALVLARDVEVTAKWAHQDSEHIEKAVSGSVSAGWGPFAVSGHYSHSSSSDTFHAQRTDQGFKITDLQVLGAVCQKVPFCPPKP